MSDPREKQTRYMSGKIGGVSKLRGAWVRGHVNLLHCRPSIRMLLHWRARMTIVWLQFPIQFCYIQPELYLAMSCSPPEYYNLQRR
jgi:hypothetical protein